MNISTNISVSSIALILYTQAIQVILTDRIKACGYGQMTHIYTTSFIYSLGQSGEHFLPLH